MAALAVASAEPQVRADEPHLRARLETEITEAITQPPGVGAPRAAKAFNALFAGMTEKDLENMARRGPKHVAPNAIWRARDLGYRKRFDPQSPVSVIRYLDNRFQLPVPEEWAVKVEVRSCSGDQEEVNRILEYYHKRGVTTIEPEDDERLREAGLLYWIRSPATQQSSLGYLVRNDTELSVSGAALQISQGGRSLLCDIGVLPVRKKEDHVRYHCTALLGEQQSFAAFFDSESSPYPLYCISTKTGAVRWKAEVWAAHPTGVPYAPSAPPLRHEVYLAVGGGFVGVFGDPHYAEVFDAQTGEPVGRFSPDLWDGAASNRSGSLAY